MFTFTTHLVEFLKWTGPLTLDQSIAYFRRIWITMTMLAGNNREPSLTVKLGRLV